MIWACTVPCSSKPESTAYLNTHRSVTIIDHDHRDEFQTPISLTISIELTPNPIQRSAAAVPIYQYCQLVAGIDGQMNSLSSDDQETMNPIWKRTAGHWTRTVLNVTFHLLIRGDTLRPTVSATRTARFGHRSFRFRHQLCGTTFRLNRETVTLAESVIFEPQVMAL